MKVLHKIRQEKVKEFTWSDIHRHLEQVSTSTSITIFMIQVLDLNLNLTILKMIQVLDLVPWREFSQSEFLEFVVPSDVLSQVQVARMIMVGGNLVMIVMIVMIVAIVMGTVGHVHCIICIFKEMLVSASLAVMAEAVANPERITKYAS